MILLTMVETTGIHLNYDSNMYASPLFNQSEASSQKSKQEHQQWLSRHVKAGRE
jgi:hypothetical protein